jgi:serine/threonine-protein kinase TTK/MPS1
MATASPTPMGSSHFGSLSRRPASRQAYRQPVTRPQPKVEPAPAQRHASSYSMDSSDDEIPVPMVFSAITNAILNDGGPADDAPKYSRKSVSPVENNRARRAGSASLYQGRESPIENKIHSSHPRRRVVRLSSTPVGSHRSGSISDLADDKNEVPVDVKAESPLDLNTPAPVKRTVRITSIAHGSHGSSRSSIDKGSSRTSSDARREREGSAPQDYPSTVSRTQLATSQGSVSRYNPSTIGRRRGVEEVGLQSSMRNRAEIGGMFAHKPMRRMRRRLDDEEQSPVDGEGDALNAAGSSQESQNQGSQESEPQSQEAQSSQDSKVQRPSLYSSSYRDFGNGSPIGGSNDILNSVLRSRSPPPPALKSAASLSQEPENRRPPLLPHHNDHQPVFKLPAPRPDLPSSHDQENEAPPTFKRNKDPAVYLDKLEKASIRPESVDVVVERATISPVRQPLAVRSQNTPRRPAPPPPKMSLLDAATRPAGAATASNASKSRNRVRVNGKYFTRLDCVGRGGSARVYRVMAENSTFYALKKVNLEDADEVAVQGFKGEINLLEKLKGEERVIRLYDYEMNDEKGILSVVRLHYI